MIVIVVLPNVCECDPYIQKDVTTKLKIIVLYSTNAGKVYIYIDNTEAK